MFARRVGRATSNASRIDRSARRTFVLAIRPSRNALGVVRCAERRSRLRPLGGRTPPATVEARPRLRGGRAAGTARSHTMPRGERPGVPRPGELHGLDARVSASRRFTGWSRAAGRACACRRHSCRPCVSVRFSSCQLLTRDGDQTWRKPIATVIAAHDPLVGRELPHKSARGAWVHLQAFGKLRDRWGRVREELQGRHGSCRGVEVLRYTTHWTGSQSSSKLKPTTASHSMKVATHAETVVAAASNWRCADSSAPGDLPISAASSSTA